MGRGGRLGDVAVHWRIERSRTAQHSQGEKLAPIAGAQRRLGSILKLLLKRACWILKLPSQNFAV